MAVSSMENNLQGLGWKQELAVVVEAYTRRWDKRKGEIFDRMQDVSMN